MDASSVEPVDVGERRPFDVLDVAPGSFAVNQLGLELSVEALGQRVVIAVASAANRGDDVGVAESLGVANAEVLGGFNRWSQYLIEMGVGRGKS